MTAELWICSNAEYHADKTCMSSTGIRELIDDPARWHAVHVTKREKPRQYGDDVDIGSCVHAMALEGERLWIEYIGDKKGASYKAAARDSFLSGKIPLNSEQVEAVEEMVKSIQRSDPAMDLLLADGQVEAGCKWTHGSGVPVKCRWDRLLYDGRIPDIKTTWNIEPDFLGKRVAEFRYDVQAALYTQGMQALFDRAGKWHFIWVCSKPPYHCYVETLPDRALEIGHETVDRALHDFAKRDKTNKDHWKDQRAADIRETQMPGWFYTRNG